ncbi:MAG: hypothetical protein WC413_04505 [Candidatus Nanoarchaeia archaeon]
MAEQDNNNKSNSILYSSENPIIDILKQLSEVGTNREKLAVLEDRLTTYPVEDKIGRERLETYKMDLVSDIEQAEVEDNIKKLKRIRKKSAESYNFQHVHPSIINSYEEYRKAHTFSMQGDSLDQLPIEEADNLLHFFMINDNKFFESVIEKYVGAVSEDIKSVKLLKKISEQSLTDALATKEIFEVLSFKELTPDMFPWPNGEQFKKLNEENLERLRGLIKKGLEVSSHYLYLLNNLNEKKAIEKIKENDSQKITSLPQSIVFDQHKRFYEGINRVNNFCLDLLSGKEDSTSNSNLERILKLENFIDVCEPYLNLLLKQEKYGDATLIGAISFYKQNNVVKLIEETKSKIREATTHIQINKIKQIYTPYYDKNSRPYLSFLIEKYQSKYLKILGEVKIDYSKLDPIIDQVSFKLLYAFHMGDKKLYDEVEDIVHSTPIPGKLKINGNDITFNFLFLDLIRGFKPSSK